MLVSSHTCNDKSVHSRRGLRLKEAVFDPGLLRRVARKNAFVEHWLEGLRKAGLAITEGGLAADASDLQRAERAE